MTLFFRAPGSLLLGCSLLCCSLLRGQSIPVTQAASLAETSVNLPSDFKGNPAILVLGFSKDSSRQMKPWVDAINRDLKSDHTVGFYQLAMLQQLPRLLRGFVLQGMRKGVSTADRAHFVPVFDNESAWKAAAHFSAADDAYVLLVDGLGHIHSQVCGIFDERKYDSLRKEVFKTPVPMKYGTETH